MLDCELEDLLHWSEVGAINLKCRITDKTRLSGHTELSRKDLEWLFCNGSIEFMSPLREGEGFYWSDSKNGQFAAFSFSDFYPTNDELEQALMAAISGQGPDTIFATVEPFGYYFLPANFTEYKRTVSTTDTDENQSELYTTIGVTIPNSEIFIGFVDEFTLDEILIDHESLSILYDAITTGEPLKSRFNDVDTAKKLQQKEAKQRTAENNSAPKAMALLSLCEYVIKTAKLEPDLINRADALTTAINRELLKLNIPEIDGAKTLYSAFQKALTHRNKL